MEVNPKSMAYRLQTVWMRRSIGDPCLFHATLYAASAHLDVFFGVLDSNIGDHQCIALRSTLVADLKASLAGKADVIWLKAAPSAFSWVCLTGAAASEDSSSRGWFYLRQGSMARAFNVDDSSLIQDSWSYFHRLRDKVRKG